MTARALGPGLDFENREMERGITVSCNLTNATSIRGAVGSPGKKTNTLPGMPWSAETTSGRQKLNPGRRP